MLKVAVITSYFPAREHPFRGNSAYQTLLRLRHLAEIEIFSPEAQYPSFLRPRSFLYEGSAGLHAPDHLTAHYITYPALPLISRPFNGHFIALRLSKHVRRFDPDVILSYVLYPDGYAALRIGQELGVPVIVNAIGSDLNRIPDPITRALTRSVLKRADFILAVSHDLIVTAIKLGACPGRTAAILNGCDTEVFHPADRTQMREELGFPYDAKLALYVGRLDMRKGLRELLAAISILQKRDTRCRLVLLGEGHVLEELQHLARALSIESALFFAGGVESKLIAKWINASDIVVLPSYMEGCPNVLLEAQNCGRPVVATRVGGIPEIVPAENGTLVSPRNVDELVAALEDAFSRQWDPVGIASRSRRKWETVAAEVYDLLQKGAGKTKHTRITKTLV